MPAEVDPAWWLSGSWEGQPLASFLELRNVQVIFRFLHRRGFSYGGIGSLVGISASRALEIEKGSRTVRDYDVLVRIADGLRIPRTMMGLGSAPSSPGGMVARDDTMADRGAATSGRHDHGEVTRGTLSGLREDLDQALTLSTTSPRQLDLIEQATAEYLQEYPSKPAAEMLMPLATECRQIASLSRRRQPASVQVRLSSSAALLATMLADALMRLGDATEARMWYRSAILAADDSGRLPLQVLVRAQAAMLPYYFGNPGQTVTMAEAALAIATPPSPSTVLAAAGRARALARLGRRDEAWDAICQCQRLFDEAGEDDTDSAFHFPAKRLLFYLSGTYTWLADTGNAYRIQEEALRLYGPEPAVPLDPAFIRLDGSICQAREGHPAEAATTARAAIAGLPAAQRTEIVLTRAEQVIASPSRRNRPAEVETLLDYVHACREQARRLVSNRAALEP
ncbi:hypothetical protein EV385_3250 [Krasilnikovia cinnamomea]|uniref:Helix-turn-helix protein n=1 Tax=Krasilnikovia cinnamomea TaxID=349313 RepID=A0A4Q7ZM04_9ACTN|nr:hypothetical protein [Krasilnikovia cinnamomea]RZU51423.1 hypothetical protein EV385_3250 [Krasilnikovia cinnamomea]